ncbi:MAG: hypothetical protein QMC36_01785 [Patescibacteria group bacterium]
MKFKGEELFTTKPEYGSVSLKDVPGTTISPNGSTFYPRIEARPLNNAEILEAAKTKLEAAQKREPL